MTAVDDLKLAELLCARLCHDLAGPVGAAAAGAELLEDGGGMADPETTSLVAASAAAAAARLKFFRSALGPAGGRCQSAGLRDLAEAYLHTAVSAASPGITLTWDCGAPALDGQTARLILNLVLIARDALPRGGSVAVEAADGRAAVTLRGEQATLGDEARAVLVEGLEPAGPRGAQAWFVRRLAEALGGGVAVGATPAGLKIGVQAPPPHSEE